MKRQNSTKIDAFATNFTKDLIILTADKNAHDGIEGLLFKRQESLGISLKYDIFTHQKRDPGCYLRGSDYLSIFSKQYRYALIIFDYEGCGNKTDNPEATVHPKYFLSAKACLGILRRAETRGKALPEALKQALEWQASMVTT